MLVAVADELQSGVPVVGAPGLGEELGLGGGFWLFGALLAVPTVVGLLLEPAVLAWSDRGDRRRMLVAALLAMAFFPVAAALSSAPWLVALCVGLWGTATGVASGIAQGVVVSGPRGPEVGMARWIRGAVIGDLLAPLVVVAVGGWRAGAVAAALVPLWTAFWASRADLPPLVDDEEEDAPLAEALRRAVTDPGLLAWSLAVASCALLDEIVLVLVALRGADAGAWGTAQVLALLAGAAVGGLATEALLTRVAARRLLLASSALSALALAAFVALPSTGVASLALLGAASAQLYPLARAAAHARVPGRPGLLAALQTPLGALDVVLPLAIGAVVTRFGLDAALLVLLLQPLAVAAAAWRAR